MGCLVSRTPASHRLSQLSVWDTEVESEAEQGPLSREPLEREHFDRTYRQMELLAQGGNASVYAGYRRRDQLPVAIKRVPRALRGGPGRVPLEVAVMRRLATADADKSAFVALLDYYQLQEELVLVLERPVPSVDLYEYVKTRGDGLEEQDAQQIFQQLVQAVVTLHTTNIFHRDIKMENILIQSRAERPSLRLIDFGLSCFTTDDVSSDFFCGTSVHKAPELSDGESYRTEPITVWQLGVVLYEMLHSHTLFKTSRFLRNQLKVREHLSPDCRDVIRLCLAPDPGERPSLEQLLKHPWLK